MAKKKVRKPNARYELPAKPSKKYKKCVLCLDPGSRNMGISCVGITKKGKAVVLANSILMNPITSLVENLQGQKQAFTDELDQWMLLFRPNGIIIERFQSRGGMGPLIEIISLMLGIILQRYKRPVKFITAATWKNAFHRRFDPLELDDMYKVCRTPPHQLDATFIGCYGLDFGLPDGLKYDPQEIMRQVEETSLLPLINRKRGKDE